MQVTAEDLAKIAKTHELTTLTDEEGRMIYAFRLFKDKRQKAGAVFTWQTHPDIEGGALPNKIVRPYR